MKGSFKLGRIAGIEIGIHYTWVIALAFISWSLATELFPVIVPGSSTSTYWLWAILAALALFLSVLLHEMAHSIVANSRGLKVSGITLFIFGGISHLQSEPPEAKTEFYMAVAGPLTSLVLAAILWGVCLSLGVRGSPLGLVTGNVPLLNSLGIAFIYYLSSINLLLALFNLIPAFPLDGGRVLRSLIWASNKDLAKSTNIATIVGRLFGWAMIAYGVFTMVTGDILGGVWIAFIGWFLTSAAGTSRRQVRLQNDLTGLRVKDVMNNHSVIISPATTVAAIVHDVFLNGHYDAVLVSGDHQPAGLITIDEVKKVPQDQWAYTTAEQIMVSNPTFYVSPEDDLNTAMRLLVQHNLQQLPVLKSGEVVGLVNRADIIRHLELVRELKAPHKNP